MKKPTLRGYLLACSVLVLAAAAIPCHAREQIGDLGVTPVIGAFVPGNFESLKTGPLVGLKVDKQVTDSFVFEGDISAAMADSGASGVTNLYLLSLQTVYPILRREQFTPFVTFGVGGLIADKGQSSPFIDFGVGAKYFIRNNLALRCEIRDIAATSLGNSFELTAGLSFIFNERKSAPPTKYRRNNVPASLPPALQPPPANVNAAQAPVAKAPPAGLVAAVPTAPVAPEPPIPAPAPVIAAPGPAAVALAPLATNTSDGTKTEPVAQGAPSPSAEVTVQLPGPSTELAKAPMLTLTIEFDSKSYAIRPKFSPVLDRIAKFMKSNRQTVAIIIGHADSTGSESLNQTLSTKRAEQIKRYLTRAYGISVARIQTQGGGNSSPIADNATVEGRQRNRRAVTTVVGSSEAAK
ncbi:OmpA family protein [Geomonas nitrogeniifigens]|uniref:OmpA family protein n=1 Tax=Geomonas diazotrophica TaxID=2843197 RepID=UPI001C2C6CCC|nr:OmpA family protein [Geomonas nitrogeniifigens]QXE85601.1 OmpA family protein [Geomonas nitrogeniifigens]